MTPEEILDVAKARMGVAQQASDPYMYWDDPNRVTGSREPFKQVQVQPTKAPEISNDFNPETYSPSQFILSPSKIAGDIPGMGSNPRVSKLLPPVEAAAPAAEAATSSALGAGGGVMGEAFGVGAGVLGADLIMEGLKGLKAAATESPGSIREFMPGGGGGGGGNNFDMTSIVNALARSSGVKSRF
jgi:hypothetical protein